MIKKDEEVREEDEMKTQEDLNLNKTAISIADIKGTDDIHGKDIADIREVVKEPVEEKKQEIYHTVEQMPQFPGGDTELLKYIRDNLQYPQAALENNIQGRVIVQFVVGKDGKVTNVQILKGVDRLCDQEAVRVIESMPQWIPGKHNGVAVPDLLPRTGNLQDSSIRISTYHYTGHSTKECPVFFLLLSAHSISETLIWQTIAHTFV